MRGEILPQLGGVIKNLPGTAIFMRVRDVDPLCILLAQLIRRVGGPHLGRLGEILVKDAVFAGVVGRKSRDVSVVRIVEDSALVFENAGLDRKDVASGMALVEFVGDEGSGC